MQGAITRLQHSKQLISITIKELGEVMLPHGLAPGVQCLCNVTHDTMPPTATEERCFLLGPLRGHITRQTELSSVSGVESSRVESFVIGSQLIQLRSCSDRQQPARM
jgi:hypothetical protein